MVHNQAVIKPDLLIVPSSTSVVIININLMRESKTTMTHYHMYNKKYVKIY